MANLAVDGLITEIKRIVAGGSVTSRGISAGVFAVDSFPELSGSELTKRARVLNTFDCRVISMPSRSPGLSTICATQLYDITLQCTVTRHVDALVKNDQTTRDKIMAQCWDDVDKITQALEHPGNVSYSDANGSLVSRKLRQTGANYGRIELSATPPNFVETITTFEGILRVNAN